MHGKDRKKRRRRVDGEGGEGGKTRTFCLCDQSICVL